MELTKSKLNKILKKYRVKLEQHEQEWKDICKDKHTIEHQGEMIKVTTPSIFDHERHNSKGAKLFKDLMNEFKDYEVFPKKLPKSSIK